MRFRSFWGIALVLVSIVACGSYADAGDDAAFLESHGFPASQFTLLWQWDEVSPNVGGHMVTGYSLEPNGTTAHVDVYRDGDQLLTDEERQALGIHAKDWSPSTAHAPAKRPAFPKTTELPKVRPFGLNVPGKIETLALPPYSPSEKLLQVPGSEPQEKPMNQIGDFREFPEPIKVANFKQSLGKWIDLPDGGALWRAAILSPGATGQRLHISGFKLSSDVRITVYNPANPDEAFAFDGKSDDLWLPTVFNEEMVVEVYCPPDFRRKQVDIEFDKIVHIYAPLTQFQKSVGSCNLDVTCHPDWAETALGICGLGIIGQSGALFCTGTLIADTDDCSTTPYVLTAHHCVGGQGGSNGASNLEFYWFYQTPTCNGTAPSPPFVPRTTGGADYLAGTGGSGSGGGGNDFTLVRMRNTPPNGVTYVGWNASVPALSTEVTDIHHPQGSYKRISFGTLTNTNNPFRDQYLEVTWHNGTTEPGSSGSPMMLTSSHEIVGQLWGGGASCNTLSSPDYFGRFSLTYPMVRSYIDPGPNRVGFSAAQFHATEADPQAEITVALERPAGPSGLDVDYAVAAGTAIAGQDFAPTSGTMHFVENQSTQTFAITLFEDFHADDGVTVALTLSSPSCGALNLLLSYAELVIADDDPDSDGDGISDYDEIHGTYGPPTNPNLADTDRDGLTDYQELFDAYGYHTDPSNPDTDGDGVPDYFEIFSGTDPTVADAHLDSMAVPWFEDRPQITQMNTD